MRFCDTCGTKLPGKGQGFVTESGQLTCGRSQTQRTIVRNGTPALVTSNLPCAYTAKLG